MWSIFIRTTLLCVNFPFATRKKNGPSRVEVGSDNNDRPQTQGTTASATRHPNSNSAPNVAGSSITATPTTRCQGVQLLPSVGSWGSKRPISGGIDDLLGGYLIQRGGTGGAYRNVGDGGQFQGGDGQGSGGGRGMGHVNSQVKLSYRGAVRGFSRKFQRGCCQNVASRQVQDG